MEKPDTFFMNWARDGGVPTVTYHDQSSAEAEAKRLCEKLNKEIFTLAAVSSVKPAEKFVHTEFSNLPF